MILDFRLPKISFKRAMVERLWMPGWVNPTFIDDARWRTRLRERLRAGDNRSLLGDGNELAQRRQNKASDTSVCASHSSRNLYKILRILFRRHKVRSGQGQGESMIWKVFGMRGGEFGFMQAHNSQQHYQYGCALMHVRQPSLGLICRPCLLYCDSFSLFQSHAAT